MADLQALILDLDGVIVDNTPIRACAFQLLFRDLYPKADVNEVLRRLNSMPATDILEQVVNPPVPAKDLHKYADQGESRYRTLY
jgi:beta-phosphoglucomutase-like phosphatase (HAD superfamily)